MPSFRNTRRAPAARRSRLCRAMFCGALLAGTAPGPFMPVAVAADAVMAFRIAPGDLTLAVNQYAQAAGIALSFDASLTRGIVSPGLQGSHTVDAGFERLLAGTGLRAVNQGGGNYTLKPVASVQVRDAQGGQVLAPVIVVGDVSQDIGTAGYVARRSSVGTKTDTPLVETPQSIAVVTREQMRDLGAQSLGDAVQYTPGVVVQEGFNRTDDPFMVRGFDVRTNPGVMFRDGLKLPLPHYSAMAEPYGLERLEILKGPASVLYGQASPGGVINAISKRPSRAASRELEASVGSNQRRQLAGDFTGPLDKDGQWTYRITGLVRDSDTMIRHTPDDRVYLAPALTWRPSADTSLTLLATHMRNKTVNNAGYPVEGTVKPNPNGRIPSDVFIGEPGWSKWDQSTSTAGYLFEHRIDQTWTFRQNFLYATSDNDVNHAYWWTWKPGQRVIERGAYARRDQAHGLTVDNQLNARFTAGRVEHNVLVGLDYTRKSLDRVQRAGYDNLDPLDLYTPTYGSTVTLPAAPDTSTLERQSQVGIYAQNQMKLDRRWVLVLSGRYDKASVDLHNRLSGATTETDAHAWTGRAGLVYLADNGLAPYVSYATSFQPQSGTTAPARGGAMFEPTRGKQWEAGVRYAPAESDTVLTGAVFDITRTNVPTTDPANPAYSIQAGEVRSRGVELAANATLSAGLSLMAAYTYTDAEVTRSKGADLGRRPAAVPRHMVSTWLDYAMGGPLAGMSIGAGVRYLGRTVNSADTAQVPAYVLVDLGLRYDLGAAFPGAQGWNLRVSVQNLLDKDYVASCTYACFYGARRTVALTAGYRW